MGERVLKIQRGKEKFYRLTAQHADLIFWFMLTIRVTGSRLKSSCPEAQKGYGRQA
jgi:hypothetical protein